MKKIGVLGLTVFVLGNLATYFYVRGIDIEWSNALPVTGFLVEVAHVLINRFRNLWSCVLALLAALAVAPSVVLEIWPDHLSPIFALTGLIAFLPLCLSSLTAIWKTKYGPRVSSWSFVMLTLGVGVGLSFYVFLGLAFLLGS
ncbi:hypothetical protein OAN94_07285 [Verrucomicrobiales bacterium]|nr:hypothetical protein [Verrucomicrobiales bacterium]